MADEIQKERSVVSSRKSKSSSIIRRQLELEMQTEEKLTKLKIQKLEEEEKLLKKKLDLQQKILDSRSDSSGCSRVSISSKEKNENVKKMGQGS